MKNSEFINSLAVGTKFKAHQDSHRVLVAGDTYEIAEDSHGKFFLDAENDVIHAEHSIAQRNVWPADSVVGGTKLIHKVELLPAESLDVQVIHTDNIVLKPAPNGGWNISLMPQNASFGVIPPEFGAYTNTSDMLVGLKDLLENGND